MARLGLSYGVALNELAELAGQQRPPDDLCLLMTSKQQQLPGEMLSAIEERVTQQQTGWFDTHPADRDRIRRAHEEGTTKVFASHEPAAVLFSDFAALARNTTGDLYCAVFGPRFQPSMMRPVAEATRARRADPLDPLPSIPID